MRPIRVAVLAWAALLAACSGTPAAPGASAPPPSVLGASASPHPSSPAPTMAGDTLSGLFKVDGRNMFLECKGTGAPTVLIESGLGQQSGAWTGVVAELAPTTRACRYDRAGIGLSQSRLDDADLSVGDRAIELRGLLEAAGVEGPYVLVGFSYGGMLIRSFADRYGAETAGLVFIDGSHEEQFAPESWWMGVMPTWTDGAHAVDLARSRTELRAATDLGDRPVIVLTQGSMNGELERQWSPLQDAIAAMSSNSLHMVATESGHDIRADRPQLVSESIRAVVDAVRGTALPACKPRFETLGAECLEGTLADLLARWDTRRASVIPAAGDLPAGTYGFTADAVTFRIIVDDGRLEVTMRHPAGLVEELTAQYAAAGDVVTFLWPFDWRIPRTSGVNTARWSVDQDGTLQFAQLDSEPPEGWISVPWVPVE